MRARCPASLRCVVVGLVVGLGPTLGLFGCRSPRQAQPPPKPSAEPTAKAKEPAPAQTSEPSVPPAVEPAPDVEEALRYDPEDPLGHLEKADALDRMARAPDRALKPAAGACAVQQAALRVWGSGAAPAIEAVGRGFVIAGYDRRPDGERVFLVHLPAKGPPRPIGSLTLEAPFPKAREAAPGLSARDDNHLAVALTDGAGALWVQRWRVDGGRRGGLKQVAAKVDTRFSPAVAHSGDKLLVAYTEGSTPMRSRLAVLDDRGEVVAGHELNPASMGAAAVTFVAGAAPPVVLAVDARDGVSPVLRIDLSSDGVPGTPQVAVPVSMVSTPPRLAAAASGVGTYVAYTGLGSAATSAIGLVSIAPIVGSPSALVAGTAYGTLQVSATAAASNLLFAATAPKAAGKNPPMRIQVHVVGRDGAGPATAIEGPGGQASHPAIARDMAGSVAVAYQSGSAVYVALLTCDA